MNRAFAFIAPLRMWTLLLLAAIGLQAAAPMRAPLERVSGSAFSASTIDVALASARRVQDERTTIAQPLVPVPPRAVALLPSLAPLALPERPFLRPQPRAPPRRHPARLPDSTAPPRT
ncbi:hypothetical protein [Novosphingobium sp. Leaf2]|uniref:hypothetical protein n=1 Tax=Novosphingobium sp. Leaf2 TaxID=1735670 RepID=UPI0006FD5DA5|nr:hypothetical protein [Novosphingobium sp. Leaf2]KQM19521.1 hypothetical protein ASE49_04655 [Novosphingobium sp. Leaf2]